MAKQFDVYRNPSAKTRAQWPYYMIIQNDYFGELTTRLIAPLVSQQDLPLTQNRISPQIRVNGQRFSVLIPSVTFLDARKIRPEDFVCNLESARAGVIAALDAIITNV